MRLAESVQDLGHEALLAPSGAVGLAMLDDRGVDAVLLDLRMPGMDGLEVLRRIRSGSHPPPVTVLTAHATAENTIEAMRLGAFDHLTKPIGRDALERALNMMMNARGPVRPAQASSGKIGLIGASEAMRSVQKTIGMLADSVATVLISGETGAGKELVARAIHEHGARAANPFVAVNCAAIPSELMESELFGHMRGSFTGATSDRKGAFREADGGTLFLDEIGDMDIAMQAKILRALQERIITPVGGKSVQVDVRVIAATHHDLGQRIHEGRFREDLFYRLNVAPIVLPPLWERTADIVPPPSSSQKYFEISSPLRGGASDSRGWSIRGGCGDRCRRRPVRRGDSFRAKRFGSWCRFPPRRWIPRRRRGRGVRRGNRRGRGAKHRLFRSRTGQAGRR